MVCEEPSATRWDEDQGDGGGLQEEEDLISPVTIMDQNVELVDTYKYLGVLLDNKLDWTESTQRLCTEATF